MPDLTPAEMQFFETGELPAELEAQMTAPPVETPEPAPVNDDTPEPVSAPAPAPAPSNEPDALVELRAQLEASRQQQAAIEENLRQLTEHMKPAPQVPKEPDPTQDPLGALMFKLNNVTQQVQELQQNLTQQQQQAQSAQQFQSFVASVKAQQAEFAKTQPDFSEAYAHLRNTRAADLRDMGMTEAQINKVLLQDEIQLSYNAQQQGRNPAQVIYSMAKRYGYAPSAAPAPAPAPLPTPASKLATISKGVDATADLPRSSHGGELTFEALKDASDDDLNKLAQNDQLWSRIVGKTGHDIF